MVRRIIWSKNALRDKIRILDYYQIFYKYTENEIRILHLWDSRRNPEDLIIIEDK